MSIFNPGNPTTQSVVVATTVPGTLATSFAAGQTIDGYTLQIGDRILIKNQVDGTENGIYVVDVAAPFRADDYDVGVSVAALETVVQQGAINSDTIWICTNNYGSDVVGTDALEFKTFAGLVTPNTTTDRAIVRWSGTDGSALLNSTAVLSDAGGLDSLIYVTFSDVAAPAAPGAGLGRIYKLTGTDTLSWAPDAAGEIRVISEPSRNYRYLQLNAATYSLLITDEVIGVIYTVIGDVTITLPLISSVGKKRYEIVDEGGNAKKNNITIVRSGSDTILNDTSIQIRNNYNSLTFYNDGTANWYIL